MQDLNDKITGNNLSAAEWNEVPSEIQNVIEGLGIALSGADLNQLGKSIAGYVANGTFYTDSGAADAYVLTKIGIKQSPTAYTDGMQALYRSGNSNTGASTINVAGLGVKDIKNSSGADLTSGDIVSGKLTRLIYDLANDWFEIILEGAVISESFTSAEQTITLAGGLTLAHGLSAAPSLMQCRIICKVANVGFAIGDEVLIASTVVSSASANKGLSLWPDATNVNIRFGLGSGTFNIVNKSTGGVSSITITSWKLIVKAWS